ncbi:MAG TPA: hypothetical protein VFU21_07145, partial [Kofleriaceae bacterium]|nr:hypothetical protein [Kofleriaceae bacterium]
RISAAGSFVWARRYGGAGNEYGYRVASFQDGRVAVAGAFTADFDMNGHALAFEGESSDRFFAVLAAASGNATYAARVGSPVIEYGFSWAAGFDDQLYGGGGFQDVGSFLGKTLTSAGSSDAYGFVVALP